MDLAGFQVQSRVSSSFSPFTFFCDFITREARACNDPSFRVSTSTKGLLKSELPFKTQVKSMVSAHKTDVSQEKSMQDGSGTTVGDVKKQCPLHKKPHPLTRCRGFRSKPIEERKAFLKENGICFRCCSTTSHLARNCTVAIKCKECESTCHISVLHPDPAPSSPSENGREGETEGENESEQPAVVSKCTEVKGGQSSRSCSKICLVHIFPEAHPERATKAYVVLDDQSNRSLASSLICSTSKGQARHSHFVHVQV